MSESKYLKFQDIDADGLIDVCDDDLLTPPAPCKGPCIPDPNSFIPDWKTQNINQSFLNTKICHFQITKVTPYRETAPIQVINSGIEEAVERSLEEKFEEFVDEAVNNLIDSNGKINNEQSIAHVRSGIEFKKFDLAARPNSFLKLLYSIPFDYIYNLADAPLEAREEEGEDEEGPGWENITFNAETLSSMMIRVRKSLRLYSDMLKVSAQIGEGNAYVMDSNDNPVRIFDLEGYGDRAFIDFGSSGLMLEMINDLKRFLISKGKTLPDVGVGGNPFAGAFKERVLKIKFGFKNKELRVIRAWTNECGEKPALYNKKSGSIRSLLLSDAWTDKTAINFLLNLKKMSAALEARVQIPIKDFVETYAYVPDGTVKVKFIPNFELTTSGCLLKTLSDEVNSFGQDLLDDVFGLAELIQYIYHESLCRDTSEEVLKDKAKLGVGTTTAPSAPKGKGSKKPDMGALSNETQMAIAKKLAKIQKDKQLQADDDALFRGCMALTNGLRSKVVSGVGGALGADLPFTSTSAPGKGAIGASLLGSEGLYKEFLQSLKVCGFLDLIVDSVGCLFQGLSLDDALPIIVQNALNALGIERMGDLFVGLPPEKQAEAEALVMKKLRERGESYPGQPWENQAYLDAAASIQSKAGSYDAHKAPSPEEVDAEINKSQDGTILPQLASTSSNKANSSTVMQLYVEALLEVYNDNLIEVINELNKFPGAQLVKHILGAVTCPRPPLFNPGLGDFIKSLDLDFCRKVDEVVLPEPLDPAEILEDLKMIFGDFKFALINVASIVLGILIIILIEKIFSKICSLLSSAVCSALSLTGDLIAALPGALAGKKSLADVFREAICGPDASDEQIDEAILDMMSIVGLGPTAFANPDRTKSFANDLSISLTRKEFADLLLGEASEEALEIAEQLIEFVYPEFGDALSNRNAINRFFGSIGNVLPLDYRDVLIQASNDSTEGEFGVANIPANPSICASPQQIIDFKNLRSEILSGRVSEAQAEALYCDLRDDTIQDLEDLALLGEEGPGEFIRKNLPPLTSEPGCSDGLLPFETPEMAQLNQALVVSSLESLECEYIQDMFGTGFTFFGGGDRNFGFLNMILCDTQGNPLTNHHRKASNRTKYVNFATNLSNGGERKTGLFARFKEKDFGDQIGQYPYYVGEWLKRQYLNAGGVTGVLSPGFSRIGVGGRDLKNHLNFNSTNKVISAKVYEVDTEEMGYANLFGKQGKSTFTLPTFGYNTEIGEIDKLGAAASIAGAVPNIAASISSAATFGLVGDPATSTIEIIRLPRKGEPENKRAIGPNVANNTNGADIVLSFKDNAMGTRGHKFNGEDDLAIMGCDKDHGGNEWAYGFELQCYYSDIEMLPGTSIEDERYRNRPDDNMRVQIVEKLNLGSDRRYASPLAKDMMSDEVFPIPAFDLPGFIEKIPFVGMMLEKIVNLIMKFFTFMFSGIIRRIIWALSDKIYRSRRYEFLSIDDTLDVFARDSRTTQTDPNKVKSLNINSFPQYLRTTRNHRPLPPQVYLLADMLDVSAGSALKQEYDDVMTQIYKDFCKLIGTNKNGWIYGADYDFLNGDDLDYGFSNTDGQYDYLGFEGMDFIPYDLLDLDDEAMMLGISRNQHRFGEDARVIYLDPTIFGGSYSSPPLYVKPRRYDGWWGFAAAFFPEETGCKPSNKNMIDFGELEDFVNKFYSSFPEDERLYSDLECARQVPFDRIMPRTAKLSTFVLVLAAVRIYISTHIMKTMGTFSAIKPDFTKNFSSAYSAYIVEKMEEDFKDAQGAFWEAFNTFKDEEFWYGFLEQSVEAYNFLVESNAMPTPASGGYLQDAINEINDLQKRYAFAYREDTTRTYTDANAEKIEQFVPGLWRAKFTGDAGFFETLRGYRERKNYEGVKEVEDSAKIILQQIVNFELAKMSDKLINNMANVGFNPVIHDMDYWILQNKCAGSELEYYSSDVVETSVQVPTKFNPDPLEIGAEFPGPYHTNGGQFRIAEDNDSDDFKYSDEYIGYYHIHMDDDGNEVYMAGSVHTEGKPHDVIVPVADVVKLQTLKVTSTPTTNADQYEAIKVTKELIDIGDVADFKMGGSTSDEKPFKIEKYTSINGIKYDRESAMSRLSSQNQNLRISDVYPGTLKLIETPSEPGMPSRAVGIEGNIGLRHGLAFYYKEKIVVTVEVDALDFKISQFQTVQPNSKLLHCLVQNLINDPKYKLLTSYIFSFKKVTSTLAIYNDMAFLASVGEVTPAEGDHDRGLNVSKNAALQGFEKNTPKRSPPPVNPQDPAAWGDEAQHIVIQNKPGSRAYISQYEEEVKIPMTDRLRDTLGLPFWYDDDIEIDSTYMEPDKSFVTGNEGWAHPKDRPRFTPFTLHWDEWDRELLRNCRSKIKRMFKKYYYSARSKPSDVDDYNSAKAMMKNLKSRLFPGPGAGLLPWWKRRKLRDNPTDANGNICRGPDLD
tara:strand:+ start:1810 stop:9126 length:7317 start_codon:yes stop_codon:yes gene_type:complete